jgi:hypothetical protein
MLILSTIRVPLPQADYHNVRHHDAPGEVCVYHDHLLRWHPSADSAADVTMLHWHWVAPLVEPGGPGGDREHRAPGHGRCTRTSAIGRHRTGPGRRWSAPIPADGSSTC